MSVEGLDASSWSAALRLLDDAYVIALVGPRLHRDWRYDVIPLMRREVADPRGWSAILPEEPERPFEGPFYPFNPISPENLDAGLNAITPRAAATLLVAMSCDLAFRVSDTPGFTDNREGFLCQARTLLDRFLPDCDLYTNSSYAINNPDHDFLVKASGVQSYVREGLDLGLIAVTQSEVALFWSIDAR